MDFPTSTPRSVWIVGALGGLLSLTLISETIFIALRDVAPPGGYLLGAISSVIFTIGLLYGAYWIHSSSLPQKRDTRIIGWFLGGLLGFLFINLGFMRAFPVDTLFQFFTWGRWAVSFGGGIGLAIGVFEARAITREIEAERIRLHQQELQAERDRLAQFANVVSHDLRNPLNVAKGRIAMAQDECDSEHLDAGVKSLTRMKELISDILTLARTGEKIEDRQSIDLDTFVETCWEGVDTSEATLLVDVDQTIWADQSRLRQAFENLIRNAVEHGGENVTVTVGELDDGFYLEDDGPGIPEDEREFVFDMSYSSTESGSGFGLAIVKEIVLAHTWDIAVKDGTDGGARFEITGVGFEND